MHYSFLLAILLCADLLTCNEALPTLIEFSPSGQAVLQWKEPESGLDYLIYAVDQADERTACAFVQGSSYLIGVDTPALEVEAIKDGTTIASSGKLINPRHQAGYPNYSQAEWLQIAPHLLPNTHPAKGKLDQLFKKQRYISSLETLKKGGFDVRGPGSGKTLVAKHKKVPYVLLKIFPDDEPINELKQFMKRINGAQVARDIIGKYQFEWLFKVPRKWIYILPQEPLATGPYPKNLILVVEDMEILQKADNYPKWKSGAMTKKKLDAIYILLTEGGFNDLPLAFNIPFCKDGLIAIVDTEDYHKWPIPYDRLYKYLSDKMADYWRELITNGGPPGFSLNAHVKKLMKSCELHPVRLAAPVSPEEWSL